MNPTSDRFDLDAIWEKALEVDGYDKNIFRQDVAGAWITRSAYGQQVPFGWVVDHIYPESRGGDDNIDNLRPMQWENNLKKSDSYPEYTAAVVSNGTKNVYEDTPCTVSERLQERLSELYNI